MYMSEYSDASTNSDAFLSRAAVQSGLTTVRLALVAADPDTGAPVEGGSNSADFGDRHATA
jgi:hypothetical protein